MPSTKKVNQFRLVTTKENLPRESSTSQSSKTCQGNLPRVRSNRADEDVEPLQKPTAASHGVPDQRYSAREHKQTLGNRHCDLCLAIEGAIPNDFLVQGEHIMKRRGPGVDSASAQVIFSFCNPHVQTWGTFR